MHIIVLKMFYCKFSPMFLLFTHLLTSLTNSLHYQVILVCYLVLWQDIIGKSMSVAHSSIPSTCAAPTEEHLLYAVCWLIQLLLKYRGTSLAFSYSYIITIYLFNSQTNFIIHLHFKPIVVWLVSSGLPRVNVFSYHSP